MKTPKPFPSSPSDSTGSAAASADRKGQKVPIEPGPRRRLLELQAELEKSVGERRVQVQEEIERMQNANTRAR